jgi:uncharacterized membrane protein YfhO
MQVSHSLNKKDLFALTVLCGFCLYLFRDIVIGGHSLAGIDFVHFYMPMKKFLYDEIHLHRSIPYWNPYIFGGMPFWAHFESTIFYPLGFLFYLMSPEKAYGYTMFLHFVLAGGFTYLLARSLGLTEFGSFAAAAIFTCNGFVMAILFLGHLSPVQSYIWLPLILFFVHRASQSPKPWGNAVTAGVLWAIQILAGAPQDAFYTFLAATFFLLCTIRGGQDLRRSSARQLAIAVTVFLVGAGLSCIQIIPAFELINESVRASLDTYGWATLASYPLQGIITILLPHFFGNYADGSLWVGNIPWSIPQQNLYTGILPIVLLGFVSLQWKQKKRILVFGGLLAVLSLILAFGHHTPIYRIVYLLPGFDRFRAPSKIMVLWGFSIALLAGIGMDGLLRYLKEKHTRRLYLFLFLVISLVALDLLFHADQSKILRFFSPFVLKDAIPGKMAEAAGIVASEFHRLTILSSFLFLLILLMRRSLLTSSFGAATLCAFLLLDLGYVHGKAVRYDDTIYQTMARIKRGLDSSLGQDKTLYRVGSFRNPFGANLEMYLGYQTVGGFTALFPSRYYEYMNAYSESRLPPGWVNLFYGTTRNSVLMDLLNVKYEISHTAQSYSLRKSFLPRAFITTNYRIFPREEIIDHMTRPSFDPKKTILFEKDAFIDSPPRYPPRLGDTSGSFDITSYHPDSMVIETRTSEPGYLFLSEIFYPGWKALVDGHPQRILRGNYLFRVIELPGGKHRVELFFDPFSVKLGIAVSSFVIFLVLGFLSCYLFQKGPLGRRS